MVVVSDMRRDESFRAYEVIVTRVKFIAKITMAIIHSLTYSSGSPGVGREVCEFGVQHYLVKKEETRSSLGIPSAET